MKYTVLHQHTIFIDGVRTPLDEAHGIFDSLEDAEFYANEEAEFEIESGAFWFPIPLHVNNEQNWWFPRRVSLAF